jgi:DNA-binding transcriptional LysR family regulator
MKKLNLNLIYLKYFCDAVKSGSISAAARLNHVSQSAVSQGISKLESNLGCTLISHQPNRFKITEDGKQLFTHAKQIFKAIETTEDFLSQDCSRITFGCTHSFALSCLPKYLKLANTFLPNLRINFRLGQYFNIKDWIKQGTIDFGILLDNDNLSCFERYSIHQGTYRLYVSKEVEDPSSLSFLLDSEERIETILLKKI